MDESQPERRRNGALRLRFHPTAAGLAVESVGFYVWDEEPSEACSWGLALASAATAVIAVVAPRRRKPSPRGSAAAAPVGGGTPPLHRAR
jgi:hypothetical protein